MRSDAYTVTKARIVHILIILGMVYIVTHTIYIKLIYIFLCSVNSLNMITEVILKNIIYISIYKKGVRNVHSPLRIQIYVEPCQFEE